MELLVLILIFKTAKLIVSGLRLKEKKDRYGILIFCISFLILLLEILRPILA